MPFAHGLIGKKGARDAVGNTKHILVLMPGRCRTPGFLRDSQASLCRDRAARDVAEQVWRLRCAGPHPSLDGEQLPRLTSLLNLLNLPGETEQR